MAAIMLTIVAGLVITLALGLLAVHRLNVISVAFIPLFVGLGVDFGVQVAVRYNAERRAGATPLQALERLGGAIGEPLAVAGAVSGVETRRAEQRDDQKIDDPVRLGGSRTGVMR